MDCRNLRRLDYIAGVEPSDDLLMRDIKRSSLPSLYSTVEDHSLKVDISVFDTLDKAQRDAFMQEFANSPLVESCLVEDCVAKAKLDQTQTINSETINMVLGHTCSVAELAIRGLIKIEQ
ncbi:MAG: hypothetical protein WCP03_01285 [Candidatus Saccharibacteria bacterium]